MSVTLLQGDARAVLATLPAESVHCCVTSPPYWGLRDYGVEGQIGLETTPEEHVAALVAVFREVRRVMRADATLWLNYGDCYAAAWPCQRRNVIGSGSLENGKREARPPRLPSGLKDKDLVGMPWRVAFALQADGWWLRSDIIWSKLNPMPESVTDRPTRAHEYLFLLAKSGRYYYDADAVREPHTGPTFTGKAGVNRIEWQPEEKDGLARSPVRMKDREYNPAGRNRRTVWAIPTEPTPEAHFATFPSALVTPCILAGTSEWGVCSQCGAPYTRQVEKRFESQPDVSATNGLRGHARQKPMDASNGWQGSPRGTTVSRTVGWVASCDCVAGIVPATVLDCFAGSGTVMKVATKLGRRSIGIDLNEEYIGIAKERNAQQGLML